MVSARRAWPRSLSITSPAQGEPLRPPRGPLDAGEKQRVGLAREFANEPRILFADEPTGNLDRETGATVTELLFALNREAGTTLVIVTHDLELAERAHRILHLAGGRVAREARGRAAEPLSQPA